MATRGVQWTIGADEEELRLDLFLARRAELGSRGRAREALNHGKVLVNDVTATPADGGRTLRRGDRVRYWQDRPGSARPQSSQVVGRRSELRIVHEDAVLLAADKPPGLLVEPLPGEEQVEVTLADLVADHLRFSPRAHPCVVHRIDRDTSGVVLFAKTRQAQRALKDQFERHDPERVYVAVLHGHPEPARGTWRDRMVWDRDRLVQKRAHEQEAAAKDAVARYEVLEQFETAALVEVRLVTGKRNQIRFQAGSRGYPLVGERIYVFGAASREHGPVFSRQALHALRLVVRHPETGRRLALEAPIPADLQALIESCRHTRAARAGSSEKRDGKASRRRPTTGRAGLF